MRLFSTEAVSKYHPDKYADQISDAILTECLKQDRQSHCGIETMVKGNTVVLGGEITSKADINYDQIVRRVAKKLGYRADKVINLISEQPPEINRAVLSDEDIGAGDQGIMFGYATRETASRLPYAFDVANRIIAALEDDADNNPDTILKGDAKTQVTIDLDTGEIVTVVVSVCHKEGCDLDEVQHYVLALVGDECVCDDWIINPAGTWTVGGAEADCGLTGRKIVCDQYGGFCRIGGGAFSGKDPSKVDRTGAYMARYLAKNIVAAELADRCEIELAYAIGLADPVSVMVDTFGTGRVSDEKIASWLMEHIDMRPGSITSRFELRRPIYRHVSCGGHFGENAVGLPWEWTDIAEVLQKEILS